MAEPQTPADDCPLGAAEQTRNVLLVGACTALSYLAAPVLYIGVVHAALADQLGYSALVANLAATAYLLLACLPLFVGWCLPSVRALKWILVSCYGSLALASALVVLVLMSGAPDWLIITAAILQGAVAGGARTVAVASEFEVLGIAVAPRRRGVALGLAYGVGPVLAILGSLATQLMLTGRVFYWEIGRPAAPVNFAVVFAASVPILLLGAFLSSLYVIPVPAEEPRRLPFFQGVFGGLGRYLRRRVVLLANLAGISMLAGYTILSNFTLYARVVFGEPAAESAGYQLAIRFACKAMMGLAMGWLLTRTNSKTTSLATGLAGLLSVLFALVAPAPLFLLSFGLIGMGELYGIYCTNYLLACAPRAEVRRYMAFAMLMLIPAAPAGPFLGLVRDWVGEHQGAAAGFHASFVAAAVVLLLGLLVTAAWPARPEPEPRS